MNARLKLNAAYVQGALIVAAILGGLFGSWLLFGAALTVLLVSAHYSGDIRTTHHRQAQRIHRRRR